MSAERRRLAWRCRRGLLELDLLLQGFLERGVDQLSASQREAFEWLLELPDQQLLQLLMGEPSATGGTEVTALVQRIRDTAAP